MKKTAIKIILDIIMTILFIALMDTAITGLNLHESIGLGICGAFLVHKLLNLDWIKRIMNKLHSKKAGNKMKIMLAVDMLLLAGITLIVVSGIFISEVVFVQFDLQSALPWKDIHIVSSYGTMILIAVHLGLHWKMIMKAFGRMFQIQKESRPGKIMLRIAALAIMVLGVKASVDTNFFEKFAFAQKSGGTIQQGREPLVSSGSDTGSDHDTKSPDGLGISNLSALETVNTPTLNDFLSNLICSGCHERCSLLNPRCAKGEQQAQQARQEYEASYSSSDEESDTTEDRSALEEDNATVPENSDAEESVPNDNSADDEENGGTNESAEPGKDFGMESNNRPDGEDGGNYKTYLEYLAILGMLTTATHYLTILGERKTSNHKTKN